MSNTVYIVQGSCGEYEDQRKWFPKAFLSKSKAIKFCEKCQTEANRLYANQKENTKPYPHKYDDRYRFDTLDYEPTKYIVLEVDLEDGQI